MPNSREVHDPAAPSVTAQTDRGNCGFECCRYIASTRGVSIATLSTCTPPQLASMLDLRNYLTFLGLSATGLQVKTADDLSNLQPLTIIHMKIGHFVVLNSSLLRKTSISFEVFNPSFGLQTISIGVLSRRISGNVLGVES